MGTPTIQWFIIFPICKQQSQAILFPFLSQTRHRQWFVLFSATIFIGLCLLFFITIPVGFQYSFYVCTVMDIPHFSTSHFDGYTTCCAISWIYPPINQYRCGFNQRQIRSCQAKNGVKPHRSRSSFTQGTGLNHCLDPP